MSEGWNVELLRHIADLAIKAADEWQQDAYEDYANNDPEDGSPYAVSVGDAIYMQLRTVGADQVVCAVHQFLKEAKTHLQTEDTAHIEALLEEIKKGITETDPLEQAEVSARMAVDRYFAQQGIS